MAEPATTGGTQAVDRAALLVSTVVQADEPLGFADLTDLCGLPKSTTSRLLSALERTELLERDAGGNYGPGPLFWQYATRHDPDEALIATAQPVLTAIGSATGETVNLAVPRGSRIVHISQVDSTFLLGTRDWTSLDVPTHAAAVGKVFYAYGALDLPTGPLESCTPLTVVDRHLLARDLDRVRRDGYAAAVDELEIGLTAIGVPVFSNQGLIAALGLSGPTSRLQDRIGTTGRLLMHQASRLSEQLGGLTNKSGKEGVA